MQNHHRKRVIIVGGGFGGLAAANAMSGSELDVILIDRTNHHLFQPLLYQVATAALSPADIASASRSLLARAGNVSVILEEVVGVDADRKQVLTAKSGKVAFDYLVLATGADYSFFGHNEWQPVAPVLKTLDDALGIRERLLSAFEAAEGADNTTDVEPLLTFAVIGGGPTGVELTGAIAELTRAMLKSNYRRLSSSKVRILLVEAGPRVLSAFTENQSQYALKALRAHGVEVILSAAVEHIDAYGMVVADTRISTQNVFWAAGTQARPAGAWLGAECARNNSIKVLDDCSVPGHPDIFAIGDVSSYQIGGKPLPGLAPVAKQQGRYVGRLIIARAAGRKTSRAFRYRNWGTMAVIGRSKAIADFGWLRLRGYPAWAAWSMVHLFLLIDFRSKLTVYVNWAWAWFTRGRGARLLTRTVARRPDATRTR
ncbi:NAD(P)/FAD-dependent oxidoreductase [Neorhizobium galegae]|uniref:NAD(P)/FAD-dependent oxidoreductase n=1 Tax=Neorhizobium galegae TaxID=399 RepID=UPI00127F5638|nr:NAD(P)/FAD-dependent oxidoreductase [Neorhizobium galegae]KAA9382368.1 NAD(P)/FAD-dependent oxidoreductase [Neorhizobium galegae]KAB1109664.1 NAD(P)/FAD-dependent oxidoreductase [Neorhizobium galegae]MCM2501657.1 NAD(P)/FAD-dependent oxidoreductase [Neorhizobium galegae]MCQ1775340.1 NAD(P)/FAD-dependent oxidoreductase [Neorhizobium galegae]MCQ1855672.1 NAD(P)/FAD-dependent oxidoreductase [Neorhizobium galegae]